MASIATAFLSAIGDPAANYIAAKDLPPVESTRPVKARSRRISGSGTSVAGSMLVPLDSNSETKGEKWYGSYGEDGISAKMMKHPHIKQSVGCVVNPLRTAQWWFKPASKAQRDREVAGFCDHCFLERLPFDLIIERHAGGAAIDGFAMSEMLDDIRPVPRDRFPNHPRPDAALVPIELAEIPANTVARWYQRKDAPTQLEAIEQWQPYSDAEPSGLRRIDANRIIRLTVGQKGANFAGIAVLRAVYGPWKLLDAFERWRAIGMERTAVGNPVAIAPEGVEFGTEEIDAIEDLLENMRVMAKGAMVLPGGYQISWEGAGENDIANLNIAIESLKTDIAVNVSAGFTRLGLTGPGSYALANTQAGQYHLSTVGNARMFAMPFNFGVDGWSPVRRIVEANYGVGTPLPTLQARNLPTKDVKTTLDLIYRGIQTKAITIDEPLEDTIRSMVEIEPHDPETARESAAPTMPFGAPEQTDEPEEEESAE